MTGRRGFAAVCRVAPWLVAATFALAILTACGPQGAGTRVTPGAGDTPPTISVPSGAAADPALVKAAGLRPCPEARPAAVRGDGLPEVALQCLGQGPDVRLAGLRGEPTLVNVWASWCAPCRGELPMLQRASDAGLRVLGVDLLDRPDAALRTLESLGVTFPSVSDPDGRLRAELGLAATPTTLFVTADGEVVHTKFGAFASAAELSSLAGQYLEVDLP
jgi:cytochrome c biogenesis protein CcmG, thiol:disulfide interchange protein DsbE